MGMGMVMPKLRLRHKQEIKLIWRQLASMKGSFFELESSLLSQTGSHISALRDKQHTSAIQLMSSQGPIATHQCRVATEAT